MIRFACRIVIVVVYMRLNLDYKYILQGMNLLLVFDVTHSLSTRISRYLDLQLFVSFAYRCQFSLYFAFTVLHYDVQDNSGELAARQYFRNKLSRRL